MDIVYWCWSHVLPSSIPMVGSWRVILDILPLPQTLSKLRNKKMTIQQKARLFHSGTPPPPPFPIVEPPSPATYCQSLYFYFWAKMPLPEKLGNHLQIATYSNKSSLFLKIFATFDQN